MGTIESALIDAGVVGAFAVFAIMLFREFTKYMEKRDKIITYLADNISQQSIILAKLCEAVDLHAHNLLAGKEKTQPRKEPTRPKKT